MPTPSRSRGLPAASPLFLSLVFLTALLLSPAAAKAEMEAGVDFRFRANVGGDAIGTIVEDGKEYTMKMGNFAGMGLGFLFSPFSIGDFHLDFNASISYGYWSTGADSSKTSLVLRRLPIEASTSLRYVVGKDFAFRAGPGLAYHVGTILTGNGALADVKERADNGIGIYGEAGLVFFKMMEITFRYTHMSLDFAGSKTDASTLGAGLSMVLPLEL